MPGISRKGSLMPESPIRKLVPYAEQAKEDGKNVLHLNIGQPDIDTPEVAMDAIKGIDFSVLEYSHSAGVESYRKGIAKYYNNIGIDLNFSQVMITTGGSEAITIAMNCIMDLGDEIIIPEPFYANYNGFSISAGVTVVPVTASIEDGFALPPVSFFEEQISEKTKAILICNPGNPTGYLYSKEELEQLKALVIKHDLFLIADEVYREFAYDGATHHSVMNLEGIDDHLIMIDSVSKRYSMCGARVGCLVSRNKPFMAAALKFGQARLSPPTLGQIAGEAALDTPQSYFDEVIEEYVVRRNVMISGLNAIEGVRCPEPRGAFYCIAELPVKDAEKFAQWMLEKFEYQKETVMIAPAAGFYSTPGEGMNQVRIAYVLNQGVLKRALKILEEGLKKYLEKENN